MTFVTEQANGKQDRLRKTQFMDKDKYPNSHYKPAEPFF